MKLYTLRMYRDDMGSFEQPGCQNWEDALWHINSARDHDGLRHMTLDDLAELSAKSGKGTQYATMTPQDQPATL